MSPASSACDEQEFSLHGRLHTPVTVETGGGLGLAVAVEVDVAVFVKVAVGRGV